MTEDQIALLKQQLSQVFVPHLPPLLDLTKPPEHRTDKNISRAFAAFSLQKLLKLAPVTAAKAVVDDYEDNGLDAIHYHQASRRLFIVQAKLRAIQTFSQEDAQSFVAGVRDLVNQKYERFNKNVTDRQSEMEIALDDATEILPVIAHVSESISEHAKAVINHFLADRETLDGRLQQSWVDFGPTQVLDELLAEHATAPVDDSLLIFGAQRIDIQRITYCGQVALTDLVALYTKHGNRLLEKNIRYFLGTSSSGVNEAIHETLRTGPANFFHLSNGVTATAHTISPKASRDGSRRFELKGLSIINGAQTVGASHHFTTANPDVDISAARVLLTLIQVAPGDRFGADVTRARNHQNPVSPSHFAALDDIQERLRRELAFDKVMYRYRPEAKDTTPGLDVIMIDEAAEALALFHPDPGFPVTLKREPSKLLDSSSTEYAKVFPRDLEGRRLANAVRLYRRACTVLAENEHAASGTEKLIYRHGRYVIMWLAFNAHAQWLKRDDVMTPADASALLSIPLDKWREKVRAAAAADLDASVKGPLAYFRNLTNTRPFVVKLREAGV
jgi:hypothetical protein